MFQSQSPAQAESDEASKRMKIAATASGGTMMIRSTMKATTAVPTALRIIPDWSADRRRAAAVRHRYRRRPSTIRPGTRGGIGKRHHGHSFFPISAKVTILGRVEVFSARIADPSPSAGTNGRRTAAISMPNCRRTPTVRRPIWNYSKGCWHGGRRFHCRSDHHRAAACRRGDLHLLAGLITFGLGWRLALKHQSPRLRM